MKTSELIGPALDWAVAKCEGFLCDYQYNGSLVPYSTNWAQGGPIIERLLSDSLKTYTPRRPYIESEPDGYLESDRDFLENNIDLAMALLETFGGGPTMLIAGLRSFVASKLGDEVDVPEELL